MILAELAFVVVSFAVQVHQVEFIDQSLPFEQSQRSVDSAAVNRWVRLLRLAQNLTRV